MARMNDIINAIESGVKTSFWFGTLGLIFLHPIKFFSIFFSIPSISFPQGMPVSFARPILKL